MLVNYDDDPALKADAFLAINIANELNFRTDNLNY